MGVDVAHLVLEAAGDTDDQVVEDGSHGAEGSDGLAVTVVDLDLDDIRLGLLEGDGQMGQILHELACKPRKHNLSVFGPLFRHWAGVQGGCRYGGGSFRFIARSKFVQKEKILIPRGPSTETTRERMWMVTVEKDVR